MVGNFFPSNWRHFGLEVGKFAENVFLQGLKVSVWALRFTDHRAHLFNICFSLCDNQSGTFHLRSVSGNACGHFLQDFSLAFHFSWYIF
jgi:hypothetical protein